MPIKTIAKERFNGDASEFIPMVERLELIYKEKTDKNRKAFKEM